MIGTFGTDRRRFLSGALGASVMAAAGCSEMTSEGSSEVASAARPYADSLGLQLYTVRDAFEADFTATLKALADIGFKSCETAGLFEHKASDVRAAMDDLGLESRSAHVRIEQFQDGFGEAIETALVLGQTNLFLPWIEESLRTPDSYREIADLLNERAVEAKAAGMMVGYHNHDFEFFEIDGERGYDILLERTDPELVKMELDFFWVAQAEEDPLAILNSSPGRFVSCHVKDRSLEGEMVAVGDGVIDFATILPEAAKLGMERFYVEHDNPEEPFVSLQRSFTHLMS